MVIVGFVVNENMASVRGGKSGKRNKEWILWMESENLRAAGVWMRKGCLDGINRLIESKLRRVPLRILLVVTILLTYLEQDVALAFHLPFLRPSFIC